MSIRTRVARLAWTVVPVAIATIATALASCPVRAQWSLEAGLEYYDWSEDVAPIPVHEHGPRFLFAGGWMLPRNQGPLIAWRGEVYGGIVRYDGALLLDPTTAASDLTGYFGTAQTAQVRWRWAGMADAVVGLEYEIWGRRLSSSQEETFRVTSLRLGAEHLARARHPLTAGAGVRFVLAAREETRIEYSGATFDADLEPVAGSNAYLHAGYRVAPRVTLIGFWDRLHLDRSNTVKFVTRSGATIFVSQPPSEMWRAGLRFVYAL